MTAASVDLLNLRWRAARWLLSVSEGDLPAAASVVATFDVEGWSLKDFADEADPWRTNFGPRPPWAPR